MPMRLLGEMISSDEFAELMAAERINPRGESRADLRMGILASVVANCNRGKKSEPFKPADFMPDFTSKYQPKKPFDPSSLMAGFAEMAARTAKKPVKKGE